MLEYTDAFSARIKKNYIVSCLKSSSGNYNIILIQWNWQIDCVGRGSKVASVESELVPDWMLDISAVGNVLYTWDATFPCLEHSTIWNSQKNNCI